MIFSQPEIKFWGGGTLNNKEDNPELKRYNKNKKEKRIIISSIIGILLVVGTIILYRTYAFFEEKKVFNVIKGQIPEFSQEDIQLSWYIGDVKQNGSFPNRNSGYVGTGVTCEKGATAEWSNIQWALVNIKNNTNQKKINCSVIFEETIEKVLSYVANVGDLVSYTPPEGTDNNIPAIWTGCYTNSIFCNNQTDQTIHPEYNKLWRIIKKNDDGTVDMISEYTSYENVYFRGKEGYKTFVDGLNNITKLYINENYIQSARSMGYNGQTGTLSDNAEAVVKSQDRTLPAPWNAITSNNANEVDGGGDILHLIDTGKSETSPNSGSEEGLIYRVYKNYRGTELQPLLAYQTGITEAHGEAVEYLLNSRDYYYTTYNGSYWRMQIRCITNTGVVGAHNLWGSDFAYETSYIVGNIRPILTVKANVIVSGNGSNNTAWKIN